MKKYILVGMVLLPCIVLVACQSGTKGNSSSPNYSQITLLENCVNTSSNQPEFYEYVFNPPVVETINPTILKTYAFGDMDGGFARTMLTGIKSGVINLVESDLYKLCNMLVQEQVAATSSEESISFIQYQSNKDIGKMQEYLINHAIFNKTNALVVYTGDILYDRLSNNEVAMATLLTKMHEYGVVFTLGNHDIYSDAQKVCNRDVWWKYERGCYASVPIESEYAQLVRNNVFVNAYFDPKNNILYSHNGVKESDIPAGSLLTAFGYIDNYQNYTTAQIVESMNVQPPLNSTNFRPSNAEMELVNMYYNGNLSAIIHGHDSYFDYSSKKVIGINARMGEDEDYIAVGIMLQVQ